jgi:hypothetical protein
MASTLIRTLQTPPIRAKKEPPGSTHSPAAKFVNPAGQARRKLTTAVHPYMKTALARGFQKGLTRVGGDSFKGFRKIFRGGGGHREKRSCREAGEPASLAA